VGTKEETAMTPQRREWLKSAGLATLGAVGMTRPTGASTAEEERSCPTAGEDLLLEDFRPKSMLHVPQTRVETPRYRVIDIHAHLTFVTKSEKGVAMGEDVSALTTPEEALAVMDRKGIRAMLNLTGGIGKGMEETVATWDRAHPGRFFTCVQPRFEDLLEPDYPQRQGDAIEEAVRAGARGLKILKTLGLYLRERITEGPLVTVDDRRFDPMWEACAAHDLPVAIHVADPEAFFLPIDCTNERWDELGHHPDWSFYGRDFPSFQDIMEARDRLYARHPKTQFLSLHLGHDAENLAFVGESLDRFPNMTVELGARIGELGRQPRASAKFFDRYQDRILFGTDAMPPPAGNATPQQVFKDELYEIYYRFLETEDEYFDYAPAPVPPQGRWRIYGLGLPDTILKKVYHDNAVRLLGLDS
jgi:predicted TIM-barrel fold metal-dependent hydrolase